MAISYPSKKLGTMSLRKIGLFLQLGFGQKRKYVKIAYEDDL